mgnify:CR=1 FL=1
MTYKEPEKRQMETHTHTGKQFNIQKAWQTEKYTHMLVKEEAFKDKNCKGKKNAKNE